jgi:hypothetical protein
MVRDNLTIEAAKLAMDLWLWNWENPNNTVTRQEAATMAYRAYNEAIKKNS